MNNNFFDTRYEDLYMEEDEENLEDMDVEEDAGLSEVSDTTSDDEESSEEESESLDEEDADTDADEDVDSDDDFKDTFNKAKSDELGNSDVITSKSNPSFVDKDTEEPPAPAEDSDDDIKLKSFGSDSGSYESPHNDYDEEELKILDELISDENHAVDRYFDAVKNTKVPILSRLYGDIGSEERFHAEQLLYAKSVLTGQEYKPVDPEVEKEYRELLGMGMDEETAASTAIDKCAMMEAGACDREKFGEIQEYVESIDELLHYNDLLLTITEQAISNPRADVIGSYGVFLEACFYQEGITNVSRKAGNAPKEFNPIALVGKGIKKFVELMFKMAKSFRDASNQSREVFKSKREWIKAHGISGIFAKGISLYLYDDRTSTIDTNEIIRYIDMLYRLTKTVAGTVGLRFTEKANRVPISNPLQFGSIDAGLDIIRNAVLTKTKVIVTKENEAALAKEFFGYTDSKLNVRDSSGVKSKSANIYNRMAAIAQITGEYAEITRGVVDAVAQLEGDVSSVYYKNRKAYTKAVSVLQEITALYNRIAAAISHDMNAIMKLDKGIMAITNERDKTVASGKSWDGLDVRATGGLEQKGQIKSDYVKPGRIKKR